MIAKNVTYEFSMEEIRKMIAKEMNVDVEKTEMTVTQEERGDDRFDSTWKEVTGVKFKVKQ